jgi:manganese/zinc/iron transport system permease protein
LLFSLAIIIVSRYAGDIHLDTDSVLLGEIAFAPFNRLTLFGLDFGAKAIYTMGFILIFNLVLVVIFFKELKIITFDKSLAAVLGFSPILINYGFMLMVSVTAVGAFESVGSILVIAFMIGPPVSAYLLTDNLKMMLVISGIIGTVNGIFGYQLAKYFDVSIAGSMALFTGISFLIVFISAPKRGLITILRRRRFQKIDFAQKSMLFHIYNHECKFEEKCENRVDTIYQHLYWRKDFLKSIVKILKTKNFIKEENGIYKLTDIGREYTIKSYEEIVSSF